MQPVSHDAPPGGWPRRVWSRVRVRLAAKAIGTMAGIPLFLAAYFLVLRHPLRPVTLMPFTAVDRLVPFWPEMLPVYASLWLYVSVPPALLISRRGLLSYAAASVALSALGLAAFVLWPTAVPPAEVNWAQHPSFAFLKGVDASGNACPSLHVAFAVFSACWFERLLAEMGAARWARFANWAWCASIIFSTMAIRQHVALDVAAGTGLGAIVFSAHAAWLRRASWPDSSRGSRCPR